MGQSHAFVVDNLMMVIQHFATIISIFADKLQWFNSMVKNLSAILYFIYFFCKVTPIISLNCKNYRAIKKGYAMLSQKGFSAYQYEQFLLRDQP